MLRNSILIITITLLTFTQSFGQRQTEPANSSAVTGTQIPAGAQRILPSSYPSEINEAFESLVSATRGKTSPGEREVLAWTRNYDKFDSAGYIKRIQTQLKASGWQYEAGGRDGDLEVFSLYTEQPKRRAVLGFFVGNDDALVFALMEILPLGSENEQPPAVKTKPETTKSIESSSGNSTAAAVLNVEKDAGYVNVMGAEMPAIPSFPALKPKAGFVRGYVKDWTGKPLQGAAIGVRSSYLAGYYSGAQGKTDAKGYYEFAVPKGSAHFYNAGYAIDWNGGIAALGLHPADGTLDSFVTMDGAVENFVLLPYGLTSREKVQENPFVPMSYYGGAIWINYSAFSKDDTNPYADAIPEDSILEITLTSEDGAGPSFVIRKTAGFQGLFRINNIPLGRYKFSAKNGGKSLKLKQTGVFDQAMPFGMTPRETTGTASVVFEPDAAQANMVSPQAGGWKPVSISLEKR